MSELKRYNYPESKPSRHGEYFVIVDDYKSVGIYDGEGFWEDDRLLNVKYFFEPATSPVSDAVDMELVKGCVKRLSDLKKYHINPYNLGEQGEVGSLITTLAQLFKLPPPSSPTPTNVQEQDEDNQSDSSRIAEYEDWEEKNSVQEQDNAAYNQAISDAIAAIENERSIEPLISTSYAILSNAMESVLKLKKPLSIH